MAVHLAIDGGVNAFSTVVAGKSLYNKVTLTGAASGSAVELAASGSDTNVNLKLTPKGSGLTQFGNAAHVAANGTVNAAFTATKAPTGAETATQGWIQFVDSTGKTLYVPHW